jgi:hypothetical protein
VAKPGSSNTTHESLAISLKLIATSGLSVFTRINESFARRFFDGRDAVGHWVQVFGKPFQIVGMVKDSKYSKLSEAPQPYFYMAFDQASFGSGERGVALYVRSDRDARRSRPRTPPRNVGHRSKFQRPHGHALVGLHLGCLHVLEAYLVSEPALPPALLRYFSPF